MRWLYASAAAVTILTGLGVIFVRLRRTWRWVRDRLECLEEVPELRQLVIEHDQALVDHGFLPHHRLRGHRP